MHTTGITVSSFTSLSPSKVHRLPLATAYGATDIGPVRSSNEDNFLIDEALGLAMVADGMGGHAAGEVASAAVLASLRDYLREHGADLHADDPGFDFMAADPDATWSDLAMRAVSVLYDAIEFANQALYAQNVARNCPEGGMGSTLTGFWRPSFDTPLAFFHVGDSRLYRQRGGQIEQLTRDQTMYQQALDAGVIENLPPRNLLLQAMGPAPDVVPDVRSQLMRAGDVLMLCSDGLHGSVPHGEMEAVLAAVTEATLGQACARLIELAKEYGGRDNITVLLALYQG
jgi:serine/threonine protein phosphatase PrpC